MPDAEADHRRHVEDEYGHRRVVGDDADDRERDRDGEHADHERQQRRDQRAEGQHQDDEREREEALLAVGAVPRDDRADVEVERRAPGDPGPVGGRVGHPRESLLHQLSHRYHKGAGAVAPSRFQRNEKERGTPIASEEGGVARTRPGHEAADVGLPAEGGEQGIEHRARPGLIERRSALEGDGEELADRTGEPCVEEVFGAGGLGLPLASPSNVEQSRRRGGPHRGDRSDHRPHDKHHPSPAHQRSGESIHQLQRVLRIFGAAVVRSPVDGAGGNILEALVAPRQRGSSGSVFSGSIFHDAPRCASPRDLRPPGRRDRRPRRRIAPARRARSRPPTIRSPPPIGIDADSHRARRPSARAGRAVPRSTESPASPPGSRSRARPAPPISTRSCSVPTPSCGVGPTGTACRSASR